MNHFVEENPQSEKLVDHLRGVKNKRKIHRISGRLLELFLGVNQRILVEVVGRVLLIEADVLYNV